MDKWRVVLLGEGDVGKTALAVKFTQNRFRCCLPIGPHHKMSSTMAKTYDPTIEDAYRKQFLVDHRMTSVEVIDTAGQEEYSALRDQWVREGDGFLLVYSVTARGSFDRLPVVRHWVTQAKTANPVIILVGNKCDKTDARDVSMEEGSALAGQFSCEFMETSAKTGHEVDRVFTSLVRALRMEYLSRRCGANKQDRKKKRKCIIM